MFQEQFVLTGSQGSFTVNTQEQLTQRDVIPPPSTGVWQIQSGTDAYERVSGHGTSEFFTATLTLSLTGAISKAG